VTNAIRAISWIQFINLGLILFVINFSLKIGHLVFPEGLFQGSYEDITSMWYVQVGTQIILTVSIEIMAPHFVPLSKFFFISVRRCWDRSCTFDKRRSRKLLQVEYEELYTGPEFHLDARLAQIVAFVWVTFMYSPGLPVLFLITALNFTIIYWVDKYLLLRFYRTPKNFDEKCIEFSLKEIRLSFVFHFIIGALVFSNEKILTSSGEAGLFSSGASDSSTLSIFNIKRYDSVHVVLFVLGQILLICLALFEQTVFSFFISHISLFANIQKQFNEMDALSDDYYEEMTLKFLISEYERTKQEHQELNLYLEEIKEEQDYILKTPAINKHIKRLSQKERVIQAKFHELCKVLEIEEPTIEEKIKKLQINVERLMSLRNYRIKSRVQSYDIRDCEQYMGVLELESLLKKGEQDVDAFEFQRQASQMMKLVTHLRKRSFKFDENGEV